MNKIKLAIFDMDGTILDTLDDLHGSVNRAMAEFGYPERTREDVRLSLGKGMEYLLSHMVPEGTSPEKLQEVLAWFKKDYGIHCKDNTRAYDGIVDLALRLRAAGIQTAVLSNKADYAVQELMDEYFPGAFDYAAGEKDGIRKKPAPDAVFAIMKEFEVSSEAACYIGDSEVDFATGQNAGILTISVTWGFRPKEYLMEQGATVFVDTPEELGEYLTK